MAIFPRDLTWPDACSKVGSVDAEDLADDDGVWAVTPTGVPIICPADRWQLILEKHPILRGESAAVRDTIERPDEIRRSRRSAEVWLCYRRRDRRYLCAVIVPATGMLLTAYPTDAIKAGEVIWTPSV